MSGCRDTKLLPNENESDDKHKALKITQGTNHQGRHKTLFLGGTTVLVAKILSQLSQDATLALRAMLQCVAPVDANAAVQWVRGDLMDPTTLDAALKCADVVVSSAKRNHCEFF